MSEQYDTVCTVCMGTQINSDEEPCEHCSGYGHLTTDAGEALIAFIERHGFTRAMNPVDEYNLSGMLEK